MLNYGKFYGTFIYRSFEKRRLFPLLTSRKPGSNATANCYLSTTCLFPEARSPAGFLVNQAETSPLIGVTPVLASTRNPSSNWMGLFSPESTFMDTVKLGELGSGLVTIPKNHLSSIRSIVVRALLLLG